MESQINSHIQLPRFILKNFRGENGKVAVFDLQKNRIRYCGANILGTEQGYYSKEIEAYLCRKHENPFSRLAARIIE